MEARKKPVRVALGSALWGIALLCWSFYVAGLILNGGIIAYLSPRMNPFSVLASILFAVLGILALTNSLPGEGRTRPSLGFALFLVPLALAAARGPVGLSEAAASLRVVKTAEKSAAVYSDVEEYLAAIGPTGTILFEDWSHTSLIGTLSADPNRFSGRKVKITGFVFRAISTPRDRFYATRFLITCCVADAEPLGLLVEGAGAANLENYVWVETEGLIEAVEVPDPYLGKPQIVPLLRAIKINPAEKPISEYLYPPVS